MWSKTTDNKSFMICGIAGNDADYKQVGEKKSSLTEFSVKCDERPNDDGTTEAVWTSCKCWHSVARCAANIKKGDMVFAVGKMDVEKWQDRNTGEEKSKKKLICEFVAIMQSAPAPSPQQNTGFVPADTKNANVTVPAPADDDYPF
ncbi:MAG: single-stranded DNA-binding protein [Ruminococcus sp.]|nr:single-stranded DNA-binding protein [Ruminococcus sp.]